MHGCPPLASVPLPTLREERGGEGESHIYARARAQLLREGREINSFYVMYIIYIYLHTVYQFTAETALEKEWRNST